MTTDVFDAPRAGCPSAMDLETGLERGDDAIAAHLASCAACRKARQAIEANNALLARLSATDFAASGGRPSLAASAAALPTIPGYEVVAELHRGGQGVVYRARQHSTGRDVALKVLIAGAFATERQRLRFEREVELLGAIDHPNVVTVYDAGRTRDDGFFLAMPLVDGIPLDERAAALRAEPDARRRLLDLFVATCAGVEAAHRRGVIHRDLKPANVLVDDEDRPHVLDLGLARLADDAPAVTADGAFLGTVAYAAPEQVRGDRDRIDVRTDVYGLGVILHEMLTGRTPHDGASGDLAALVRAVTERDAPRASAASAPGGPRVDGDLDAIVARALDRDPDRRYQSVSALADDARRALAGEPVDARRGRRGYVLRRTIARHRVAAGGAALVLTVIVAFGAVSYVQFRRADAEAAKVRQINLFLEDTLGSVQAARGADEPTVRALLDEALPWITIALDDEPEIAADLRTTIGNAYRNLGQFPEAERQLVAALDTRRALFGDDHPQYARSLNALGLLRRDEGRLDEARASFDEALRIRRSALGPASLEVAITLANRAETRRRGDDLDGARADFESCLAIRRARLGDVHGDVAMTLYRLGALATEAGRDDDALARHAEALAIRRRVLHPLHPDFAQSLLTLGRLHRRAGRLDDAHALLAECHALRRAGPDPDHWRVAEAAAALAAVRLEQGHADDAEALLAPAVSALEAQLGADDARTREARALLERVRARR